MEVLSHVHQVRYPLTDPRVWVALNLFLPEDQAEGATLLDTGLPATPQDLLIPYFAKIELPLKRITTIVNTHFHGDHTGGNAELKALTGARLAAHRDEVAFIENPGKGMDYYLGQYAGYYAGEARSVEQVQAALPRPAKVDEVLADGQEVKLSGRSFQVVHTPGHTAGSISLFDSQRGEIFCGDALQAEGTIDSLAYYHDLDQYLGSLDRVEALEVSTMVVAHGYRPWGDAVLKGPAVKRFMQVCREVARRYDEQIEAVLRKAGHPLDLGEITTGVRAFYGMEGWNFTSIATVKAHLHKLEARGAVSHQHGPREMTWSAW